MPVDLGGWTLPAWSASQKWQDTLLQGMLILSFLPCVNTSPGMALIKGTLFPGQSRRGSGGEKDEEDGCWGGESWPNGPSNQLTWWRQSPLARLFSIISRTFAYIPCWDLQHFTIWQLIKEKQESLVIKGAGWSQTPDFKFQLVPLQCSPAFTFIKLNSSYFIGLFRVIGNDVHEA